MEALKDFLRQYDWFGSLGKIHLDENEEYDKEELKRNAADLSDKEMEELFKNTRFGGLHHYLRNIIKVHALAIHDEARCSYKDSLRLSEHKAMSHLLNYVHCNPIKNVTEIEKFKGLCNAIIRERY